MLKRIFQESGKLEGILENTPDALIVLFPEHLEKCLPMIASIIEKIPDKDELRRLMEKGGCMTTVEELGLSRNARRCRFLPI